jgi:hypothetical protein
MSRHSAETGLKIEHIHNLKHHVTLRSGVASGCHVARPPVPSQNIAAAIPIVHNARKTFDISTQSAIFATIDATCAIVSLQPIQPQRWVFVTLWPKNQ